MGRSCSKCKLNVYDDSVFCTMCGAKIVDDDANNVCINKDCPNSQDQTPFRIDAKYCNMCGKELSRYSR